MREDAGWGIVVATHLGTRGERIRHEGLWRTQIGMHRRGPATWQGLTTVIEAPWFHRRECPELVHRVAMRPALYRAPTQGTG